MNLLNQALGVHEQALQVKSRRLEVLAQNIANADTPNYKARDIDFKAVLGAAQQQDTAMTATASGHFGAGQELLIQGDNAGSALLTLGFFAGVAALFRKL